MADYREIPLPFGKEIRTGTTDSILASLFRTVLADLGINVNRFNTLLNKYIVHANIPMNTKEISSVRGNLKKELLKSVMTWKVFVKGLLFLGITKFDITIRLYHANGRITDHAKSVTLDKQEQMELEYGNAPQKSSE